jgi:hypothetical protein
MIPWAILNWMASKALSRTLRGGRRNLLIFVPILAAIFVTSSSTRIETMIRTKMGVMGLHSCLGDV